MIKATGQIIKVISRFCDVLVDQKIYRCELAGILRHQTVRPTVGDRVNINLNHHQQTGIITAVLPRKNLCFRPAIANVDQAVIVTAIKAPRFSSLLLNKYLVDLSVRGIKPIILFTKADLLTASDLDLKSKIATYQALNYTVVLWSNTKPGDYDLTPLIKQFANQLTVFTGQTGAGKSSTLNYLSSNLNLATQPISKALNRGKSTTRYVELYPVDNGQVADSPGFSSFNLPPTVTPVVCAQNFPGFSAYFNQCKFNNCLHDREPGCAVKLAFNSGKLAPFLYQDYLAILHQLPRKDESYNA